MSLTEELIYQKGMLEQILQNQIEIMNKIDWLYIQCVKEEEVKDGNEKIGNKSHT
jgi:hypothetical protein